MRLTATTRERGGVTLVELLVENGGDAPRRVRVRNRLDGPAWPPRRDARLESGWDEEGYEGVLEPGERRALGYAAPAPARDPPAEIVAAEPADGADEERRAEDVLADLGDPRPPRGVVGCSADDDGTGAGDRDGDAREFDDREGVR